MDFQYVRCAIGAGNDAAFLSRLHCVLAADPDNADGLREVLFSSQELINRYSVILIWIIVIGLVLVWVKNLFEKAASEAS